MVFKNSIWSSPQAGLVVRVVEPVAAQQIIGLITAMGDTLKKILFFKSFSIGETSK
jgi:hypothetical protein